MVENMDTKCVFVKSYVNSSDLKNIYYHHECSSEYHISSEDMEIDCPKCSFYKKKIEQDIEVAKKLEVASNKKYSYVGLGYKDNKASIVVKNQENGNYFLNNNLDNLVNKNNQDPYLNMSSNEQFFFDFISKSGITTNPFDVISIRKNDIIRVSKNKQPLRIDFTLNLLSKPILAIEIDSLHHDREIQFFDSYSSLKKRIKRDLSKDVHLLRNLIPVVRLTPLKDLSINHSDDNIIKINEVSFVAKVIGHQEVIERNLTYIQEMDIDSNQDADFKAFIVSLKEISKRTNPFSKV